jgi:MFS transporter, OFA family, oxalate/formate antiporter
VMIPGGKIQDRYGPKFGATLGGLFLASGCLLAGLMKSYFGLILGFGILGGIGMGLGYAAATPAAVKWFGPHRRGLIVGIVVAGYGGAAIYISPFAKMLIAEYGLSGSFIGLGILFAAVVIVAGRLMDLPPEGYVPPPPTIPGDQKNLTTSDWSIPEMLKTWQFYGLVFLFIGTAQSGLLVIANAAPILNETASTITFFAVNAWLLSSFNGVVNATGRVGTGLYSDRIGRRNAYLVNGLLSVLCLLAMPSIIEMKSILLLFIAVGIVIWQYGGGLALMPAFTADYFGAKNLGTKYGLVFIGWGIAFLIPQGAAYIKDLTKRDDLAFYLSSGVLALALIVSRMIHPPIKKLG